MKYTITQSKAIRADLVREMRSGIYAGADHLPPETELALSLGISRTQLRDVLAGLEQEGFITRRHGIGTLINHHVLDLPCRMDIETEFMDMIRQSGFQPGLAFARACEEPAGPEVAGCLLLPPETPVIRISRLCTADGRPAIYCEDVVEKALVRSEYTLQDLEQPIFNFLHQFCRVSAYLDLTDLRPVAANDQLSGIFRLPPGTPLLHMREVDYDIAGKPVFYSTQYFADGFFRHSVLRKKL